jgi:hypothetical protein
MPINFRVRIEKTMRIFGVLIALTLATAGCGGGGGSDLSCAPTTVRHCVELVAGGCERQGRLMIYCMGNDMFTGCVPNGYDASSYCSISCNPVGDLPNCADPTP